MNATQQLHDLGQSLWLDNITRDLLTSGSLSRYIHDFAVTGLTSNPTIFDLAIRNSTAYDDAIREKSIAGKSSESLLFELMLEDLVRAADLFRPIHEATGGTDGWVSLEVSPGLVDDTAGTIEAAVQLHARAQRQNLFIKIPGTPAGVAAIAELIFIGVPVNVTLLFSCDQYRRAADAYFRGIERRIAEGRDPQVGSVASFFVSRWDTAVAGKVPEALRNRLGVAVGMQTYKAYCELLASSRWQALAARGVRPQRLLWASTGAKDPAASDVLYVESLAAPDTINTVPEKTLLAFADHGRVGQLLKAVDAGYETQLSEFAREGVDVAALGTELQRQGAAAFATSWSELLRCIASRSEVVAASGSDKSPQ